MKIFEISDSKIISDEDLFKMAKSIGTKMYGSSHSGLILLKKITRLDYSDYVRNSNDFIDTYDYVFFPSSKRGLDVADQRFNKDMIDTDGKIYVAGSNGIFVLSNPFKKKTSKTDFPDIEFNNFKKAVVKYFPKASITDLDKYDRIFAYDNRKLIGQFLVKKDFGDVGVNQPAWLIHEPNGNTLKKFNW